MKYSSSVNNYRETPYIISDTFANQVNYSAAIKGAIYICRDGASLSEPSIFQANGTVWVAIGAYGIGTDATLQDVTTNGNTTDKGITITALGLSTNTLTVTSLTPKSIPFVGTADLLTEDNTNLVWDNVNKRLGINTNTPGNSLDVHGATTTPIIALNNTAAFQSAISFLNSSISKWRLANKATTNDFEIYNFGLTLAAINISNADNRTDIDGNVYLNQSLAFKINTGSLSAPGFTTMHSISGTGIEGLGLSLSTGGAVALRFNSTNNRSYTFPNSDGTVALTTDLAAYLPLTAGTLTGLLTILKASSTLYAPLSEASRFPTASQIYLNNSNAANDSFSGISLQVTRTSGGNSNAYIGAVSSATNPEIVFGQRDGTNDLYIERARITSAGNLLIGTTNDVGAKINAVGGLIRVKNVDADTGLDLQENGSIGLVRQRNNRPLGFYANNAEAMRIWENGNVFIGTVVPTDTTLAKLQITGNLQLTTTGNKLLINATVNTAAAGASTAGSTTLIAGTIVVSTTAVTANSIILITAQSGTITGSLKISARSAGTSFTILSTVLTDTPLVGWLIIN